MGQFQEFVDKKVGRGLVRIIPQRYQAIRLRLAGQEAMQAAIREKYRVLFMGIEEVWERCTALLGSPGIRIGAGVDQEVRLCAIAVHSKTLRVSHAGFTLCSYGLGLEAQSQARTLFETYTHLKLLVHSRDRIDCAREYRIWDIANDDLAVVRRELEAHPEWEPILGRDLRDADALRIRLGPTEWNKFVDKGPARISFKKLVNVIGHLENSVAMDKIYKTLYHETSGQIHGFDNRQYAIRMGPNDLLAKMGPSDDKVQDVSIALLMMLIGGMRLTCNLLEMGNEPAIEDIERRAHLLVRPLVNAPQ